MENMRYAFSAGLEGLYTKFIRVEVNIKRGIPRFSIVGLATASTKEATDRVRIALENSGYEFPMQSLLVNLAPADSRKDETWFDLPIAILILIISGQLECKIDFEKFLFLGELGLDGSVKPMRGLINILASAKLEEFDSVLIPYSNRFEASMIQDLNVFPIQHISELKEILLGERKPDTEKFSYTEKRQPLGKVSLFNDQIIAMRGLTLSVAGKHHSLLMGNPGAGKTMLARMASDLQMPLSEQEYLEILKIKSSREHLISRESLLVSRPFRNPHHTASDISIVGGGRDIRMGEITLAHNGILFLDELGEFKTPVIQSLREPMEEGKITISRVNYHLTYPASFILIAATNPCPCGYFGSETRACICSEIKINKYISKMSGPFLDRIDITVELNTFRNEFRKLIEIDLDSLRSKISDASEMQKNRFQFFEKKSNGLLEGKYIETMMQVNPNAMKLWEKILSDSQFSIRKSLKIKKLSRTIADMEGSEFIEDSHIYEALQYQKEKIQNLRMAA